MARRARSRAGIASAVETVTEQFRRRAWYPTSFERCISARMQAYRSPIGVVAAEEINYRRFSTSTSLPGCAWSCAVVRATHRLVFNLIERGTYRVCDRHIDGLSTRGLLRAITATRCRPLYVLVEKILGATKFFPPWPIAAVPATTSSIRCSRSLSTRARDPDDSPLPRFIRRDESFDDVLYASKKRIAQVNLQRDNVLAHEVPRFVRCAMAHSGFHTERSFPR